jgi:hypothetical protein
MPIQSCLPLLPCPSSLLIAALFLSIGQLALTRPTTGSTIVEMFAELRERTCSPSLYYGDFSVRFSRGQWKLERQSSVKPVEAFHCLTTSAY